MPAVVALAWLMARPNVTAAIASATSLVHVQELAAAEELVRQEEELTLLQEAGA